MSETKKLNATGLSQVWSKIVEFFVVKEAGKSLSTNDFTNELKTKLDGVAAGAQANVIEKITVNGVEATVTEKNVVLTIPTGELAELDTVDMDHLAQAVKDVINGKATKATTLEGYGIKDAYTKTETEAAIAAIGTVFKVKGSVAFANLPTADMQEGDVYNVTDDFTTTSSFVEGAGKEYPAGTNVVYTAAGWDAMAGTYDFSGYMLKSDLVDITEDEINAICVIPPVA